MHTPHTPNPIGTTSFFSSQRTQRSFLTNSKTATLSPVWSSLGFCTACSVAVQKFPSARPPLAASRSLHHVDEVAHTFRVAASHTPPELQQSCSSTLLWLLSGPLATLPTPLKCCSRSGDHGQSSKAGADPCELSVRFTLAPAARRFPISASSCTRLRVTLSPPTW